jgi:hypothetical protein
VNNLIDILRGLIIALFIVLISACQLLTDPKTPQAPVNELTKKISFNFNEYYLLLKTLSNEQLLLEITKQTKQASNSKLADLKLLLLYSLPKSPIHNPYTAKSKLNSLPLTATLTELFSDEDLAFFTMLKDQLNQQLLLFNLIEQVDQNAAYQQQRIQELQRQIEQLKTIEKNINEREQDIQ